MENLIPIINNLQDVMATAKSSDVSIELPQIVVVGNQSSGKSSVLESIVGKDFLPRGVGIVTRCPLILQLVNIGKTSTPKRERSSTNTPVWKPNLIDRITESFNTTITTSIASSISSTIDRFGETPLQEWAEFLHLENKRFYDLNAVRKEIEDETNHRTNNTKRISEDAIRLKIYSSKVANLTLIDLPGMTKVPLDDQPKDIERQVRDLIVKYIQNPNSIILAVTAANTDPATSEAIKLAKEFDPEGKRTLAVLTKLDLMDKGTDATAILEGKVITVKLGIIGVVNRSQQDIINNKSIQEALDDETEFLIRNYPDLEQRNGSSYLIRRLSDLLMKHIQTSLPDLRSRVNKLAAEYREKLKSYGGTLDANQKSPKLLQIVSAFTTLFQSTIEGTVSIEKTALCGGAKICDILIYKLSSELNSIDPLNGLKDEEIRFSIKNATGLVPALNVPQRAFELIVKEQLKMLEEPCLGCAEWVKAELDTILEQCQSKIERTMCPYPILSREMLEIAKKLLADQLPETKKVIKNNMASQLAFINVKNAQFHGEYTKLINAIEQANKRSTREAQSTILGGLGLGGSRANLAESDDTKESLHCEAINSLVTAYFNVTKEQMGDKTAKDVVCFLVNSFSDQLATKLNSCLHQENRFDELFFESADLSIKRRAAADMLETLEKGLKIINQAAK